MREATPVTKDPIHGKTSYFCCDHCRQQFLSVPAGSRADSIRGAEPGGRS